MNERDVLLNELAQGLRPMSHGIEWFDGLGLEEQSAVLLFLRHHCVQACAVAEDAPEGIRRAGLRPTHTPAVLISRGRIDEQLGKIAGLTNSRRTPQGVQAADRSALDRRRAAPRALLLWRLQSLVAQAVRRRLKSQHRTAEGQFPVECFRRTRISPTRSPSDGNW